MIASVKKKLADLPRFKDTITVGFGQEKFDEKSKKAVFAKAALPRGARIGKRYVRFAREEDIDYHAVTWSECYVDGDLYSRDRRDQLQRPKLIFAPTAPKLRSAFDDQGLYLGRALFSTGCRTAASYAYLAGVINSMITDFAFSARPDAAGPDRIFRLEPGHLAELPLLVPDPAQRKLEGFIDGNVMRLMHFKQARHVMGRVWDYVAGFNAARYASLAQLFANKLSGQKEPWVKKLVPSLASLGRRTRKYEQIRLQGDGAGSVLRLYGTSESGDEVILAEAEFGARDLMLYTLLATGAAQRRRTRPVTLRRVLSEDVVPLAAENPLDGARLVLDQFQAKLPKALAAESVPIAEHDLARVEQQVDEMGALIDAEVFRIYGLTWDETAAVMNWLNVGRRRGKLVETYYNRVATELPEVGSTD
jgi:hypothetical protein